MDRVFAVLAIEAGSNLTDPQDPLVIAMDFIEHDGLEEKVRSLRQEWFRGYERRPEVLRALDRFLSQRGLVE